MASSLLTAPNTPFSPLSPQVFFPVGFWQYKPNLIYDKKPYPTTIELMNKVGHYDTLSYEHSSFYISDYISARQLMLPEDLWNGDLFEMFIKYR